MAYSYILTTVSGGVNTFNLTFDYISKEHIKVFVNNIETQEYSWFSDSQITVNNVVNGDVVKIQRNTPKDTRLVDFTSGGILTEADLDKSALQTFFITQEAFDTTSNVFSKNESGNFDAENVRIVNVSDPVNPQDAATREWVLSVPNSPVTHDHNNLYYTIAEIDAQQNEVDTQLDGKADVGHNHDGTYEPVDPDILRKDQNAVLEASFSTQPVIVDDSASLPTPDLSLGNVFKWTWGANRIFSDVTLPGAGAWYIYIYPNGNELSGINSNYDVIYNGFDATANYCVATIVSDGVKKSLWIESFMGSA
jgi:hypothetical protein